MFIAMNRFKIILGKEKEFEDIWKNRDTYLIGVPGFKEFHLVKATQMMSILCMHLIAFGTQKMILLIGLSLRLLD